MINHWFIKGDFLRARSRRIGASDLPALIPNPERPTESLAGYGRTAITVWEEKTDRIQRSPAGLPAEMGHWNEPKAIELFMRPVFGEDVADQWLFKRVQYEILKRRNLDIEARLYQEGTVLHSCQYYTDEFICHPDGVFRPISGLEGKRKAFGFNINLDSPFLIEGKSARFWSAKRPAGSLISGYDPDLKTWQGIPFKHYVQIQFQLALFEVGVCYLPLLYDTSSFHVWEIQADRKRQNALIDLAGRMAWYIKKDIPPKELAINSADIKKLYPAITEDFVYVSGEERARALTYAVGKNKASKQIKIWKAKEQEATDSLSVLLKDRGELRDEDGSICKWVERKGSEKMMVGLKDLKQNNPTEYRYLKRKKLIETAKGSKYVSVSKRDDSE